MRLLDLFLFTATLIASTCTSTHATDDGRPRGVKKVDIPLYTGSTFTCRSDPSIIIPASHINDDYCDCTDGSDEPGTSACERGNFWCRNVGWRGEMIKASRVNDGICDCCDGSDEWQGRITCPNTCVELGKSAGEDQLAKIQKMEAGAAKRTELVTEAERVLAERKAKLAKYEARIAEKATILEELRQKKEAAEAIEAEEKRIADEIQAAKDAEAARLAEEKAAEEAANAAANPPVEGEAAQSSDGTPTTPPADKPVEVEIPATPDATPSGIAGIGMAGVGIPKIPEPAAESFPYPAEYAYNPNADKDKVEESATQPAEDPVLKDAQDDEYNDEEDEPAPPAEPTRTEAQQETSSSTPPPPSNHTESWLSSLWTWLWPPTTPLDSATATTKASIAKTTADAARAQYNEMESSHRKTQDKLEKVKKLLENDYGDHGEFTMLEGQCYQIVIRQYTYEVCPYDESRQIEGHSRTSLGKYSGWRSRVVDPLAPVDKGHVYGRIMEFTGGVTCWNGPQRSAAIEFECGEQTAILTVDEPSRCVYAMRMSTPAVCKPEEIQAMREKLEYEMKLTAESEE